MRILRTASSLTSRNIAFSRLFPLPGHYTVLVVGVKETGDEAVPERKLACCATLQGLLIPRASSSKKNPPGRVIQWLGVPEAIALDTTARAVIILPRWPYGTLRRAYVCEFTLPRSLPGSSLGCSLPAPQILLVSFTSWWSQIV